MQHTMPDLLEKAAVFRYHKSLVQEHGRGSSGALGWTSPEGQLARFEVLAGMADFTGCSVLDAGCGHGDLYPYLKARFAGLRYFGVEQIPELLDIAAERYGSEEDAAFFFGDFLAADLPAADYVLACGSLSYRHSDPAFVQKAIRKLFDSCRLGLGFNLLSREPLPGGLLAAYEPGTILAFCREIAASAELVENYRQGDFTIFARH